MTWSSWSSAASAPITFSRTRSFLSSPVVKHVPMIEQCKLLCRSQIWVRRFESEVSLASFRALSALVTSDAGPAGGDQPIAGSLGLPVPINTSAPLEDIHASLYLCEYSENVAQARRHEKGGPGRYSYGADAAFLQASDSAR